MPLGCDGWNQWRPAILSSRLAVANVGDNGSGKTTLVEAFAGAIYVASLLPGRHEVRDGARAGDTLPPQCDGRVSSRSMKGQER